MPTQRPFQPLLTDGTKPAAPSNERSGKGKKKGGDMKSIDWHFSKALLKNGELGKVGKQLQMEDRGNVINLKNQKGKKQRKVRKRLQMPT